uniref:Putative permease of the major facilitator superfamily protein n=1 Tax=Lutzomyia longipalpis TaxID=7200 RepID=A0A1B0GHQ7_LUTLO
MYNNDVSGEGFPYPIERALNKGFDWKLWKTRRFVVTFMGLWGLFNLYTVFGYGPGISYILNLFSPTAAKLGLYPLVVGVSFPSIQEVYSNWAPEYEKTRMAGGIGCLWFLLWAIYIKRNPASDPLYLNLRNRQGVAFPSIQDVYSNWAPEYEKTTMAGLVQSGCQIGAFTSFLISGFFVEYFGWESVFYIFVWAQTVPNSCDAFATFTYLTQIPSYLNDVLGFNLGATGFFSAAPFLMFIILTPVASGLSDFLRSSKILSTTNVRKICISAGFLTGAICLIIMSNSKDMSTIWACLIVAVGTSTFMKTSYFSNPIDFAPAYASIIIGYSTTFASIPAIVAPTLAGFIVRNGTQEEWKVVFYIIAGLALFGMIFFILFGQGELQEWAKCKTTQETSKCIEPLQEHLEDLE